AGTDEQHPDGQGRIMLSADHRRYAGLAKECVVNGAVDFLEIWEPQAWQTYLDANEESYSQAREELLGDIV
ncbi:MAG: cell division/cell wall cluster transcriptional repressor MraZ, partial [Mycobacteriaceae bacterium]